MVSERARLEEFTQSPRQSLLVRNYEIMVVSLFTPVSLL